MPEGSSEQCVDHPQQRFPKSDIRYWQARVFQRVYQHKGSRRVCRDFSVDLLANGRRGGFNLGTSNKMAAAHRAREIYQRLKANRWTATLAAYKTNQGDQRVLERRNKRLELLRDELKNRSLSNGKLSKRFWEIVRGIDCTSCGFCRWPSILQFHHIDRDQSNNSLANLPILCPNCHRALHHRIAGIEFKSLAQLLFEQDFHPGLVQAGGAK
jgi:hypothetical protein